MEPEKNGIRTFNAFLQQRRRFFVGGDTSLFLLYIATYYHDQCGRRLTASASQVDE